MVTTPEPFPRGQSWPAVPVGSLDDLIVEILTRHYHAATVEIRQAIGSLRVPRLQASAPRAGQSPRMKSLGALRANRVARESSRRLVHRVAFTLGAAAAASVVFAFLVAPSTWFGGPADLSAAVAETSEVSLASLPQDPGGLFLVDVAAPTTSAAAPESAPPPVARAPLEFLSGLAPVAPLTEAPLTTTPVPIHRIQPGDTLYAIASRFGTTTHTLAALNGLADPNFIVAGEALQLP